MNYTVILEREDDDSENPFVVEWVTADDPRAAETRARTIHKLTIDNSRVVATFAGHHDDLWSRQ